MTFGRIFTGAWLFVAVAVAAVGVAGMLAADGGESTSASPSATPIASPVTQDSLLAVEASGSMPPGVSSADDDSAPGPGSVATEATVEGVPDTTGNVSRPLDRPAHPETSRQEEGAAGTSNEPTPLPTALAVPSSRGEVAPILPPVSLSDLLVQYEASEPERMLAVAWCESRYSPSAVNRRSGARGTWQFMAPTWAWVRESLPHIGPYDNAFDVALSTEAAVWLWKTDGEHHWRGCLP